MPHKVQVVVYTNEYDTTIYTSKSDLYEVEVIDFDVSRYEDLIPDEWQMKQITTLYNRITLPDAKEDISHWYNENLEASIELEKEIKERKKRRADEAAAREEQDVKDAIELLKQKGIRVPE